MRNSLPENIRLDHDELIDKSLLSISSFVDGWKTTWRWIEKEIFIIFPLQISNWNDFFRFNFLARRNGGRREREKGHKTCFEYISFYARERIWRETFTHCLVLMPIVLIYFRDFYSHELFVCAFILLLCLLCWLCRVGDCWGDVPTDVTMKLFLK